MIGIDLGTTFTCAAVWRPGHGVAVIPNAQGDRTTPSRFTIAGNDIFSVKRVIGRQWNDPIVLECKRQWPFAITRGKGDAAAITLSDGSTDRKSVV